ncbi:MAG: hypothetical protein K8T10_17270 [Candidatus Eremiobacteraeota bacterium]|nr:hypothetical protein [Candidatus Eremiobacteraeota bacterium]
MDIRSVSITQQVGSITPKKTVVKKEKQSSVISDKVTIGKFSPPEKKSPLEEMKAVTPETPREIVEKKVPNMLNFAQDSGKIDQKKHNFFIREGLSSNYFFSSKDFTSHVMLTDGQNGRIYVSFPVGNSGMAMRLDPGDESSKGMKFSYIGEPREFSRGKNDNGVSFKVKANKNRVVISDVHLDSIRFIRDLKAPDAVKNRWNDKRKFLDLTDIPENGYLNPSISVERRGKNEVITITRKTLDRKNTFYTELRIPDEMEAKVENGKLTIESKEGGPVKFGVASSIDYKPLTPYTEDDLLNNKASIYREKLKKTDPQKAKRFGEALQGLSFLSYHEKFLAGSWRFLTYFGRDTMMSLMMLRDSVDTKVYESAMQSVLDGLSPEGAVAHEEDIGSQAIAQRVSEYNQLRAEGKNNEAAEVKKHLSDPIYDYKMIDDDYMLPHTVGNYISDDSIAKSRKLAFLNKTNQQGEKNVDALLKNFDYALKKAERYTETGDPKDLIRIAHDESVGDWRDSNPGLGWGVYPCSVNVDFVADSLSSVRDVIDSGVYSRGELQEIASKHNLGFIRKALESPEVMDKNIKAWHGARDHYKVDMSPDQVRGKLKDYMENYLPDSDEKDFHLNTKIDDKVTVRDFVYGNKTPDNLKDGLSFYALSLDKDGKPVEVMNSDAGFRLFNGNPSPEEIRGILKTIDLPYPLGLAGSSGIFVANPVFASNKSLRKTLDRNGYHGTVVWSWHMALMEKGLMKQIKRFQERPGHEKLAKDMFKSLSNLRKMEQNAGDLVNSELWTYKIDNGKMKPIAYGAEAASESESNPVQLWSTVGLSTMREFDEVKESVG